MDLIGHAMRTAGIPHNVLLTWDNLESDYTKTKAYWNNLEPDLMNRYAIVQDEVEEVTTYEQPATKETATAIDLSYV